MSGWVTVAFVLVALSMPTSAKSWVAWGAWTLVSLAILFALLVDAKGWP